MPNPIASLYVIYFLFCGTVIAAHLMSSRHFLVRLWTGLLLGLVGMMWCVVPFAFLFQFSHLSHAGAVLLMGGMSFLVKSLVRKTPKSKSSKSIPALLICLFLIICLVIVALKYLHIILPGKDGLQGGPSTYGDLPLHLSMITSFAEQGTFPRDYSIYPGIRLSYPFLVNLMSGSLHLLGMSLRWSVLLPDLLLSLCVVGGFMAFCHTIVNRASITAIATVMFFFSGGLGFIYFVDKTKTEPENFTRLFGSSFHAPTNLVEGNLDFWNVICHIIIPQRSSLAGWAVLFFVLWLIYQLFFQKNNSRQDVILAGILAGLLPMIHTASFLVLVFVILCWLAAFLYVSNDRGDIVRKWAPFILVVSLLALPQLVFWTFSGHTAERAIKPHFNWANYDDNWLWYWLKNAGLVFVLSLPAAVSLKRERIIFYSAAVLLFMAAESFSFSPVREDNNKIFYLWFAFSAIIVAEYIVDIYDRLSGVRGRRILVAFCVIGATFSGALTVVQNFYVRPYIFSNQDVKVADFVRTHTLKNGLFATSRVHNNSISSLAGRNILCGGDSWLFSHGINFFARANEVDEMFKDPKKFDELQKKYGIDYVFIGLNEKNIYHTDSEFFNGKFPRIFDKENASIYAVSDRAKRFMEGGNIL